MSSAEKEFSIDFVVVRHVTEEDIEKDDIFKVIMKPEIPEKGSLAVKNIEITSSDDSIFTRFPKHNRFKVVFKNPQTKIEDFKEHPEVPITE